MQDNTPVANSSVPKGWEWVLDICTEARFPELGMPARWQDTAEKNAKILINPTTGKAFDPLTGDALKSVVGFIKATKGTCSMPGAETPAAARVTLYNSPEMQGNIILNNRGDHLVPCIVHGDYVRVESLQADHLHAKEDIKKRQDELVETLNKDHDFAEYILKQPGMDKFFVKYQDNYYGSYLFYQVYFNDIDNLWLICGACNLHKSNQNTIEWLKEQWLYGQEFLDYLGKCSLKESKKCILEKTKDNKGLAEVAIEWFWKRHANYISTAKQLMQNLTIPIQVLNQKIDHIVGNGSHDRAERLQASIEARIMFASSFLDAKVGMPKGSGESHHDSSDEDMRLTPPQDADGKPLPVNKDDYRDAAQETVSELKEIGERILREKIKERLTKRYKPGNTQ